MSFTDLFDNPNADYSGGINGAGQFVESTSSGGPGFTLSDVGTLAGVAGSIFGTIGNVQAEQATASGYRQEANLYDQAASIAGQDIGVISAQGTNEQIALDLKNRMTEASAGAAEGAAGFNSTMGSAGDILRMSQQQGALILGQAQQATQLQENEFTQMQTSFEAQAAGARSAANAAQASANSSLFGGLLGSVGRAIPLLGVL